MYIAMLGRQPDLGIAELEQYYGSDHVRWFSDISALIERDDFIFDHLGGSLKAGKIVFESNGTWAEVSKKIISHYLKKWRGLDYKITLGISAYGFTVRPHDIQRTGLTIKGGLRKTGTTLRLVPNPEEALNTASSHHNKLGLSRSKVELLVVRSRDGRVIVAESIGSQNISAFAARDQGRPKRDSFVGMLPPKLARLMVNLAGNKKGRVLDPFCGTGVVLQEALLLGHDVLGTDLSEKMVAYSQENIEWATQKLHLSDRSFSIAQADAMNAAWQPPINSVVAETYLGQPFSAPPSPAKLTEVRGNCNHIISTFLKNLAPQIQSGSPVILAVPAWKSADNHFTHLPFIQHLDKLGYTRTSLKLPRSNQLLYYREDQIVARELLLLVRS